MRILLVANYQKGNGGISGVVENYQYFLRKEKNVVDIFNTKLFFLKRIFLFLKLTSVVKNYDVVHIHGCSYLGFFPIFIGIIACKYLGDKKAIVTYHGGGASDFLSRYGRFVLPILKKTDKLVVMSENFKQVFKQYGLNSSIIKNIVNFEKFELPEKALCFDFPNIISLRSLEKNYNIIDIIQAFAIVKNKYTKAKLTILGTGSQLESIKSYIEINNISDVIFPGKLSFDGVLQELSKSNIMISVPSYDNQPMSVLESFFAGVPVISSKVGGILDLITDKYNGLLVDPNNPIQIFESVDFLMQNNEEAVKITFNAKNSLKEFSWENNKSILYEIYRN